jgi:formamidopyrimidine-DNA glycosylase
MPELPEVEAARAVLQRHVMGARIVRVADIDTYVCRPHSASELAHALVGRTIVSAHRKGKLIWCETSLPGGDDGHLRISIHLGMGGRIVITDESGRPVDEGDSTYGRAGPYRPGWDRFTAVLSKGLVIRLVDKRRLGRVRLDPDLDALGPDALTVDLVTLRRSLEGSRMAIKARLLDQATISGIGNLIADETLWQSAIPPHLASSALTSEQVTTLHRKLKQTLRSALKANGSDTGTIIAQRHANGHCPRCGARMAHETVGGRSTWYCSREQA